MMAIEEVEPLLAVIEGAYAQIHSYEGLRTLNFVVARGERLFYLACLECEYIAAPTTAWGPISLSVSRIGEEGLLLEDPASNVRIVCHMVGLVESEDDDDDE